MIPDLYRHYGHVDFFAAQAAKVKLAFQRAFINPETGIIKDGEETLHSSLHANMFALAFNLVPENNKSRILDHIQSRRMANDRILKNGRTIKAIPEGKFWKIADVEPGVYSWEVKYL